LTEFAKAPDGVRIAYEVVGQGDAVVLVHGFAASRAQNWRVPGWYETLTAGGYRVIALDCRGHGESDKPHDPASYGRDIMARDLLAVMQAAGVTRAFLMGYSMGGFISMHVLLMRPELLRKVVIGGVGASYLDRQAAADAVSDQARRNLIADALVEPDKSKIANPMARTFREFAEQDGKDRLALAACMRADRKTLHAADLARSMRPVLIVCGADDGLTGPPDPLAAAFADGRAVTVPKRDHMTTVGDKVYKQAVLEFFSE
jgi:pimeloyl-ACP methyl ester carboxylesterase